ncbi:hypothetical protein FRC06_001503, partial [Ceratobasidium sp. 370]
AEAEVDPVPTPAPASAPAPIQAPAKRNGKQPATPKEPIVTVSIPKSNKDEVPAPLSPPKSRKSVRVKKPSEIAEKVNVQVTTNTPHQSPAVTLPPRKDCTKVMEQLVNSHFPSPNPSVISGASASTGTDTRTSSIAPSDSVSQTNVPNLKKVAAQSLQVPQSGLASRNVSPTAPPSLSVSSSVTVSRGATPSAESTITVDEDCNNNGTQVDVNTVLAGVPKPWNVGPALPLPELPGPFYTATSLKPDVLQQLTASSKDKGKLACSTINSFQDKDQQHLKLCLEFMDILVATICAFPNNEMLWTFVLLSNYWACKKLGRNYRLSPDSEHFCLLSSHISQSCGKLVTPAMSDRIHDHYKGLSWQFLDEEDEDEKDQVEEEIRQRIVEMIEDRSFLALADKPMAYFQNRWLAHVLKTAYWKGSSAKSFSPTHAAHFGGRISYPMLAFAATATKHMLNVVASRPSVTAANYRNPSLAFSHKLYYTRFDSHLMTIVRLHNLPAGPKFREYLKNLHATFMGSKAPSVLPGPGLKLTIPLLAFDHYEEEVKAPLPPKNRKPAPSSSKRSKTKTNLATLLENPLLTGKEKLEIINTIFRATEEATPTPCHPPNSMWSSRQYKGLLTEVNAEDDDDSEAEARRAGVLPDAGNPGSTAQAWTTESDSEMVNGGDKSKMEGAGKTEGEGKSGDDTKGESEGNPEGAKPDASMLDLKESDEEGGTNAGGDAEGGADGAGDTGEDNDNDNDNDNEATKTRARRFLCADSAPLSDDGGDPKTDGEGAAGAVLPQRDADASMQTVDSSDNKLSAPLPPPP